MNTLKRIFKRNSHNSFLKGLAGFGRALNRLYENRNHDIHSNGELNLLKKLSKFNPQVIIDGGANVGNYSKVCSFTFPNAKIYSFEPVESTFNKLKDNVKHTNNVFPLHKGLYSEDCIKEINLYISNEHSSIYDITKVSQYSEKKTKIKLIKGDDFLSQNNIECVDFLKLDLEGAEYDAILGFEKSFESGKIKVVQFEYGYINVVTKNLLLDYYNLFEKYGYVLGKLFPKKVEFRDYNVKYEDFIGPNFVAVNKNELYLIQLLKNK